MTILIILIVDIINATTIMCLQCFKRWLCRFYGFHNFRTQISNYLSPMRIRPLLNRLLHNYDRFFDRIVMLEQIWWFCTPLAEKVNHMVGWTCTMSYSIYYSNKSTVIAVSMSVGQTPRHTLLNDTIHSLYPARVHISSFLPTTWKICCLFPWLMCCVLHSSSITYSTLTIFLDKGERERERIASY